MLGGVNSNLFQGLLSVRRENVLPFAVVFEPFACDGFVYSPLFSSQFYATVSGWGHMIFRVVNIILRYEIVVFVDRRTNGDSVVGVWVGTTENIKETRPDHFCGKRNNVLLLNERVQCASEINTTT